MDVPYRLDRETFRLIFRLWTLYTPFGKQRCIELLEVSRRQLFQRDISYNRLDMYPDQDLVILDRCGSEGGLHLVLVPGIQPCAHGDFVRLGVVQNLCLVQFLS